jgi:hypothetical protein
MHVDLNRLQEYPIADDDWAQGWRYTLNDAVDKALEEEPDGTVWKIEIQVKKRGDRSFHDWLVSRGT